MTHSPATLAAPEARPPQAPGPPRMRTGPARAATAERARRYRRAFWAGVAGSVLLHLLVLRISPLFVRFAQGVPGAGERAAPAPPPARGIEVILLFQVAKPTERTEPREARRAEPRPAAEPAATGRPGPAALGPTAAEILRPRVGDWRLVVPPPVGAYERPMTPAEREAWLNERLRERLAAANDSAAAAARREAAALDWTVGEEGNRWGLSPGKIHLGGITVPLPFSLSPNPWQAREQADRARSYEEIQRQGAQAEIDESVEDRVRAIRERREAERRKARETAPADTAKPRP
jgi:hypothetical protein